HGNSNTLPVLVRQVPGADRLFAVAWIRPEYLWDSSGKLPEGMQLCVNGARGSFRACRPRDDQPGQGDMKDPSQARLTASWSLFLRARFGVDEWSIEASLPRNSLLAPLSRLRTHAVPTIGAAVLVALLLGSALIQLSFRPLERLLAGWNASNG